MTVFAVHLRHPRSLEQFETLEADFGRAELLSDHVSLTSCYRSVGGALVFVVLDEMAKTGRGIDGDHCESEEDSDFHVLKLDSD